MIEAVLKRFSQCFQRVSTHPVTLAVMVSFVQLTFFVMPAQGSDETNIIAGKLPTLGLCQITSNIQSHH